MALRQGLKAIKRDVEVGFSSGSQSGSTREIKIYKSFQFSRVMRDKSAEQITTKDHFYTF